MLTMNRHIESKRWALPLACLAALLLLPAIVFSQPVSVGEQNQSALPQTGQERIILQGTVHDPTGALIVRAQVRLVHEETSQTFVTATDQRGHFSFSEKVPAGTYRLFIADAGFKEFERGSLELSADQPTQVDAVLDIAPILSQIMVAAQPESQLTIREAPVRVSTGVIPGGPLRMVSAEYPVEARASGIQGRVVIEAIVNAAGEVISAKAIEGHPLLIDAALTAAKKWQYRPTLLSGQPVPTIAVITMDFSLSDTKVEVLDAVPVAGREGMSRPQITYLPRPEWTAEAKAKRIMGTITLSAVFAADGTVQDVRVIRGLGYGLDEKAVKAAKKIKFTPATDSSGNPASVRATIRVEFNLL